MNASSTTQRHAYCTVRKDVVLKQQCGLGVGKHGLPSPGTGEMMSISGGRVCKGATVVISGRKDSPFVSPHPQDFTPRDSCLPHPTFLTVHAALWDYEIAHAAA